MTAAAGDVDGPRSPAMIVFGDSLAYYGPAGGLAADDRHIWPNLVGRRVGLDVELFARIGWTSRDVWWALTQDPRVWAAIPRAQVIVLAYTGMDSLPSPVPTALREQIRYIRPPVARRAVRAAYGWVQPRLSPAGWPMALPPKLTVYYLEKVRSALAAVVPDVPIIAMTPPTHVCDAYGHAHPGRDRTTDAVTAWAHRHGITLIDPGRITAAHQAVGDTNPDGIHWSLATHREVADEVAPAVADALVMRAGAR
ncbi:SGNH/GDSL hydrolase family protein [Gordonia jinhuaensis]|uniref:Diglucosylglycerate octanoyltransferase n=1 Tax=Gordonia jinhuaensis TaxID=1517702 RepID=A0A916WR54_9ACTN|nr:diglucosylglycerate octanoyltransferase [Gordonia jinhuaensis]GGB22079.1 diglucosylglycerate octanoyltransferase [Gordonia jinhuaensis]